MKDKLDAAEISQLEAEVNKVKEALKGTDTDAIKAATESLTQAFYKVSEKMYQQSGAQPGGPDMGGAGFNGGAAGGQQPGGPDDVVDADYTVVDDQ
jgi:molecular chaperone DnaK